MYNKAAAERVIRFMESLKLTKDPYYGKPLKLIPYQKKLIQELYGTYENGHRQYKEAFIMTPRKNAKSATSAGLALYHTFADGVNGGEGYIAASDKDQASLIFKIAALMVEQHPEIRPIAKVIESQKTIVNYKRNTFLRAIPADVASQHGYNASFVVFDEVHTQKNMELYDVLITSQRTRKNPMFISITTAGFEEDSNIYLWRNLYRLAQDSPKYFYSLIFEATKDDDWQDEDVWKRVNPALGYFLSIEEMRQAYEKAKRLPSFENTFKRLYLNMPTSRNSSAFSSELWQNDRKFKDDFLNYKPCYCGLDLASTKDITAFVAVFDIDGEMLTLPYFFIPEENMRERCHRDHVPYDVWAKQGLIIVTPGNATDYDVIYKHIIEFGQKHKIMEILYDRWNALAIIQRLESEGVNMIPWGQGFASMSWPTKETLELASNKKIIHRNNEVLKWMALNTVLEEDAAGNQKPNKAKSFEKIDGIVALIMAIAGAQKNKNKKKSVYENRGAIAI